MIDKMIGFTFRNRHTSEFNLCVKTEDRSLVPERRKNTFVIPGQHGEIDYEMNTYEKRPISVILGTFLNEDWVDLRLRAREIAQWLSGDGLLVFDDEPDKAYTASVYNYIGLNQFHLMPQGEFTVEFNCQPFAQSVYYRQKINNNVTANPHTETAVINGTVPTPCIISIKNIGTTNVSDITIKRKAQV